MKLLAFLIALLPMAGAFAAEAPRACVPTTGLSIGGVSLVDSRAAVIAKLGKPDSTGTYQAEDDGGPYTGTTLIYPQVELEVDELRGIERIASRGSTVELPFGLKAGMSAEQAGNLLHFIPTSLDEGAEVLPACGIGKEVELRLHFSNDELGSVELVQFGP